MEDVPREAWPTTPAGEPPEGVTSNFHDPVSIGHRIQITSIICLTVVSLMFAFRVYVRKIYSHYIGVDDWLLLVSYIFFIAMIAICLDRLNYGLGRHIWDVPLSMYIPKFSLYDKIYGALYVISNMFVKLSILAFLLRISPVFGFRMTCFGLAAFITVYAIVRTVMMFTSCNPVAKAWDPTIKGGSCQPHPEIKSIVGATINMVTDLAILGLAIWLVVPLKLRMVQKVALAATLAMGSFACVITIIRFESLVTLNESKDSTWDAVNAQFWVILEMTVSIICCGMPTYHAFIRKALPHLFSTSSSAYKSGSGSGNSGNSGSGRNNSSSQRRHGGSRSLPFSFGSSKQTAVASTSYPAEGSSGSRKMSEVSQYEMELRKEDPGV